MKFLDIIFPQSFESYSNILGLIITVFVIFSLFVEVGSLPSLFICYAISGIYLYCVFLELIYYTKDSKG